MLGFWNNVGLFIGDLWCIRIVDVIVCNSGGFSWLDEEILCRLVSKLDYSLGKFAVS